MRSRPRVTWLPSAENLGNFLDCMDLPREIEAEGLTRGSELAETGMIQFLGDSGPSTNSELS